MNTHRGRLIRLSGTPYEIGYAMGRHMGTRLEATIARYIGERAPDLAAHHDWQQGALPWLRTLPQRYQDEFAGLADGAGLPLQRVAEWPYVEVRASAGCTSALVRLNGHVWVARNNDYLAPDLWGYGAIKEVTGRIPTLTFGMEGDVFAATGINRERLWLHYHYLPVNEPPPGAAWPCYLWLVEALETCRTLADIESLLAAMPRDGAMLLFAVDGKVDEPALFECQPVRYQRAAEQDGMLVGTNHSLSAGDPNGAGTVGSARRYERIAGLARALASQNAGGPDDSAASLIAILADGQIEARDRDGLTVYANVACPATGELWYTFGGYPAASRGRWERLESSWAV